MESSCDATRGRSIQLNQAQHTAKQLTAAQRKWVLRGVLPHSNDGRIANYDFSAFGQSNFNRMMARLAQHQLVAPFRHGGYELTEYGKRVAAWLAPTEVEK